ncbi:MAG TPA: ABC transporter permease [Vicinamibacterales bacterium]|nr:ABC transporter permease [Vicinamibacterales bacterium]
MSTLWNDLRYAARLLVKTPAFTVVAVATLALGIGANTAIFSVVAAALLNPLPFPDSDRLVVLTNTVQRDTVERRAFSYPDYRDVRDRSQSFEGLAAWSGETFTLSAPDAPARQVEGELASAAYFDLLGATPVAGRVFTKTEDEERDAHALAVVSHPFWQRQFGGSPSAIGSTITLNDRAFTVIGVLPRGFKGLDDDTDVWIPMGMLALSESARFFESRGTRWLGVVARMKRGVSLQQANADVVTIARQLEQTYPDSNAKYGSAVFGLKDETVGSLKPLLLTMLAAVAFVLLIGCVNLANLMLARASARQRETAIRAALGADRRRLARQFIAEGLLLSALGAAAGLLLALWSVDAIIALAPAGLPSFVVPRLDGRVLLFVIGVTCGAGLLLGMLPAWQGSRADLNDVLKQGARGSSGGSERTRTRSILVVAEVALSLLLLVGAGLMVRSFLNLQRVDVGFRADRALTMQLALPGKYTAAQLPQTATALMATIAAVPGVQHVAIGTDAPMAGGSSATIVSPEGVDPATAERGIRVYRHGVTPGFFAALGAAMVSGRDFDSHDARGSEPVAIVSRRFAAKAWPGADPIGRRLTIGRGRGANPDWIKVVGMASDLRYRSLIVDTTRNPEDPDIYFPFAQRSDRTLSLVVSTTGSPAALTTPLRDAVHAFDHDVPTFGEGTFAGLVSARMASFRLSAGVMSFFGLVALLLAGIGVYGLINYSVMQRRQEMGVRLALGAGRREIYGLVLKDAVKLTTAGLLLGIVAAIPSARLLQTQLYGVTAGDPVTYVSIVALLLTVAIGATLLPARRAARVDPIVALRAD